MNHDPEAIYRAVFESSPEGILIVDEMGTIVEANPRIPELFGYDLDELVGRPVEVLVPGDVRNGHERHRNHYLDDPHARPMGIGMELRAERKDGTTFPVEVSLSPLPLGGGLSVVATIRDLTQRKRLRDFGAGALRASEEERQRIARELHDDTAQHLATLLVQLEVLQRAGEQVDWRARLEDFRDELKACAEGVRRIARGLRPPELEDAGVEAALRSHLRAVRESCPMEVRSELESVDGVLDLDAKLALYRIVQEAVSNATRHAGARELSVVVERGEDEVRAVVRDDGRGFEPGSPRTDGAGLGLVGMRERATMAGGRVAIRSEPGQGTTVEVRIPFTPSARADAEREQAETEHV